MPSPRTFAAVLAALFIAPAAASAQTRSLTFDDLAKLRSVSDPQRSPDGKWVAYTVSEADFKQNAFITHVWLANAATGRSVQLTRGEKSATSPQWSPDSQWLIGADIAGKDLLIARADGTGEPRRIPLSSGNSVSGPRLPVAWQPVWP